MSRSRSKENRGPAGEGSDRESRDRRGEPRPEDVACRAYELFVARGAEPGSDVDDWLRAEAELRGRSG